jgi:hypothetical protein
MGAYYTWINQQRLAGAEESRFLVWFENQKDLFAIAHHLPRGTLDTTPTTLEKVLATVVA